MKSNFLFKLSAALFFSASPITSAAPFCASLNQQLTKTFEDIYGKVSDSDRLQLSLLEPCAKRHNFCVIVQAPSPRWFDIAKGNTQQDLVDLNKDNRRAVSSLSSITSKDGRKLCLLSRFGGGTASVWTIDGWESKNSLVRNLDTDMVELRGEYKKPADLLLEVKKVSGTIK